MWREGQNHVFPTPRIVVNLAGTWRNATRQEIIQANYKYPREILEEEMTIGGKVIWIQASSYYQIYKNLYGVDKDLYSKQKQLFSNLLKNKSFTNKDLSVLDVSLPYLTGPNEPSERIFSKLAFAKINNKSINLSSGDSIMPILDVRDFSTFIADIIYRIDQNLYSNYEIIYPCVSDVLSLRCHIEKSLAGITHLCNFNLLPDRTNEFTVLSELEEMYKIDKKLKSLSVSFNDQVGFLISKMPKI
jgi:hypothetical protein